MATPIRNAWGVEVEETKDDPWYTEKEARLEKDDPTATDANAMYGGNDLDGWTPEDGAPE